MLKKIICLLSAAGLLYGAAYADTQRASRPCAKADLVGEWNMTSVKPLHDPKDPVFYPHQRFIFDADSSMKFMSSPEPFTKDWLEKFEKQPRQIDYSLDEKGHVTLIWQNRPHSETAACAYILKDVPPEIMEKIPAADRKDLPKKGNVSLSFLNSDGKIAYRKILEK